MLSITQETYRCWSLTENSFYECIWEHFCDFPFGKKKNERKILSTWRTEFGIILMALFYKEEEFPDLKAISFQQSYAYRLNFPNKDFCTV